MPALRSTTTPMARASYGSAVSPSYSHRPAEIAVATSRSTTRTFWNWASNFRQAGVLRLGGQFVGTVSGKPRACVIEIQATIRLGAERRNDYLDRLLVRQGLGGGRRGVVSHGCRS